MHFVLERAQHRPELKPAPRLIGLKMYTLELQGANHRNIIFKDTFHYLMCSLSTLPKTFGLKVQDKGFFPHLFTKRENPLCEGERSAKKHSRTTFLLTGIHEGCRAEEI